MFGRGWELHLQEALMDAALTSRHYFYFLHIHHSHAVVKMISSSFMSRSFSTVSQNTSGVGPKGRSEVFACMHVYRAWLETYFLLYGLRVGGEGKANSKYFLTVGLRRPPGLWTRPFSEHTCF